MTPRDGDRVLMETVLSDLASLGFSERSHLSFARDTPCCIQILNFGGRVENEEYKFTFSAGIRFPKIEAILRPGKNDSTFPTISMPIHLLHDDRRFFEWGFTNTAEAESIAEGVLAEISERAQPFFDEFSVLSRVEKSLASENALDWFVLTPDQRVAVRASIAKVSGRDDDARGIISEALENPQLAKPAKRRRIEELRSILFPT